MTTNQYGDLPQIPRGMDEQDCYIWSVDHDYYEVSYNRDMVGSETECNAYPDGLENSATSLQPMQRFIEDQGPFDPHMLHAKAFSPFFQSHSQPWPGVDYTRNASPDRTSISGLSSHASYSDIQSPHTSCAELYNNSTEHSDQSPACFQIEPFYSDSCLPEPIVPRTIVNPRDVEYDHQTQEPEPATGDFKDMTIEREHSCDHESSAVELADKSTPCGDLHSGLAHSVRDAESVQPVNFPDEPDSDSDYRPRPSRSNKRKRALNSSGSTTSRVSKCHTPCRRDSLIPSSPSPTKRPRRRRSPCASKPPAKPSPSAEDRRLFLCPLTPYGCDSKFASKNEWKRHVSTQHIKEGFWRCDMCVPTTSLKDTRTLYYNDFNRLDLFRQHLRRMHSGHKDSEKDEKHTALPYLPNYPVTEENLVEHQIRCYQDLRSPPLHSACLFCTRDFSGPASWAERMDHVGFHFEQHRRGCGQTGSANVGVGFWRSDPLLERYLEGEGLIVRTETGWMIGTGVM